MNSPFMVLNGSVRFDGNCETTKSFCGAICCKQTVVPLTDEEKESGKYEYSEPTEGCDCPTCKLMRSTGKVVLKKTQNGCIYLDGLNKCSIYDDRPSVCRSFDCENTWWQLRMSRSDGR
jgi:Fe-S-cluster containining protein